MKLALYTNPACRNVVGLAAMQRCGQCMTAAMDSAEIRMTKDIRRARACYPIVTLEKESTLVAWEGIQFWPSLLCEAMYK